MQKIALLLGAGLTTAQVVFNNNTGQFDCALANANFCAGDSLGTDIIIRCNNASIGQPGRCTDNLAGQPPLGVNPALCYESSPTAGDAACEKNCILYPEGPGSSPSQLPASECTASGSGGGGNTTATATATASVTASPSMSMSVPGNGTVIPPPTGTGTGVGPTATGGGGGGGGGGSGGGGSGGGGDNGGGGSGGGGSGGGGSGGGSGSETITGGEVVPTAAAAFHGVGALAAAGGFAVYFFL